MMGLTDSGTISIWPAHDDSIQKLTGGANLFSDHPATVKEIPDFLKSMHFLFTSKDSVKRVIPVTEGKLYVMTPPSDHKESEANELLTRGFEKLEEPLIVESDGQLTHWEVFTYTVHYERFRLKNILLKGWAVPLFIYEELPSMKEPGYLIHNPQEKYFPSNRLWQGCPSIEITGDHMWAAWFSGGTREPDHGNYGIIARSIDKGENWTDPFLIIEHPNPQVRIMDPQLWTDPKGRLWVMWVQNTGPKGFDGIWGTWAVFTENPEDPEPVFSSPRRLCHGLTRNKPTVLSTGEWLLPSYDWINFQSTLYISNNEGQEWQFLGGPINEPVQNFYENMCVELKDGKIWMLQRHIHHSVSTNRGITWPSLDPLLPFTSANSRLYIGRLQSGNLLLIFNDDVEKKRNNMTAYLSPDEGKTWPYRLVLDEREDVSYPEAVQGVDGRVYVCYDRSRGGEKEILMSVFREEDVIAGRFNSIGSESKVMISKVQ
ncbi:MAG TPA: sialidase family protein [Saprospiraceae bacterium]|nr:sialidase family protein [Saprospiraceae bacterium]